MKPRLLTALFGALAGAMFTLAFILMVEKNDLGVLVGIAGGACSLCAFVPVGMNKPLFTLKIVVAALLGGAAVTGVGYWIMHPNPLAGFCAFMVLAMINAVLKIED